MQTNDPTFEYRIATPDDLEARWARNIANNPGDDRWITWKDAHIQNIQQGVSKGFVVIHDNMPVGEGTLLFSPLCVAVNGRLELADGKCVANINALRMDKPYRGKGHMSKLVKFMEHAAKEMGYSTLTIGVEPNETRNLAIYLHWGYDTFVMWDVEEDGELVLYYSKKIC